MSISPAKKSFSKTPPLILKTHQTPQGLCFLTLVGDKLKAYIVQPATHLSAYQIEVVTPLPNKNLTQEKVASFLRFYSLQILEKTCRLLPRLLGGGSLCCGESKKSEQAPLLEKPVPINSYNNQIVISSSTINHSIQETLADYRQEVIEAWKVEAEKLCYIPAEADLSLETTLERFFKGTLQTLLITAEGGMGKSLYLKFLEAKLWNQWKQGDPIPLRVHLPALEYPFDNACVEAFKVMFFDHDLDESLLGHLQNNYSFVFLFDSYDELFSYRPIYISNKIDQWNAKLIITCRTQYLEQRENYKRLFLPKKQWNYNLPELRLRPFHIRQIESYLKKVLLQLKTPWPKQRYLHVIETCPALKQGVTNPYILNLVIQTLPTLWEAHQKSRPNEEFTVDLHAIYQTYVEQWFLRQAAKINKPKRELLPLFNEYSATLAQRMELRKTNAISGFQEPWKQFFRKEKAISLARSACPIHPIGPNTYSFLHEGLREYFLTVHIENPELPFEFPVRLSEETLFSQRLFTDTIAEQFASKHSQEKTLPLLRKWVERSKTTKNKEEIICGTNAFSTLVKARYPFSNENLSYIQVPNANATNGIFWRTNFHRSNLSGVSFQGANCDEADLTEARCQGIKIGLSPLDNGDKSPVQKVAFSQEANLLAISTFSTTKIWDLKAEKELVTFSGNLRSLLFSPQGNWLVGIQKKKLIVLDIAKKKPLFSRVAYTQADPVFSNNGHLLFIPQLGKPETIEVIETENWEKQTEIHFDTEIQSIAVFGSEPSLFIKTSSQTIDEYQRLPHSDTFGIKSRFIASHLFFGIDGNWGAIRNKEVLVNPTSENRFSLAHKHKVIDALFFPSKQFLLTKDEQNTAHVWQLKERKKIAEFLEVSNSLHASLFLESETQLIFGHSNETIKIWDWAKGKEVHTFINSSSASTHLFYAEKEQQALSVDSKSSKIFRFDLNAVQGQGKIIRPQGSFSSLCKIPNTFYVATTTKDGEIHLWDQRNGGAAHPFPTQKTPIFLLSSSSNGKQLLTCSKHNKLIIWDLSSRKEIAKRAVKQPPVALYFLQDSLFLTLHKGGLQIWQWGEKEEEKKTETPSSFSPCEITLVKEVSLSAAPITWHQLGNPLQLVLATKKQLVIYQYHLSSQKFSIIDLTKKEQGEIVSLSSCDKGIFIGKKGEVSLINLSGKSLVRFPFKENVPVMLSASQSVLFASNRNGKIFAWDIKTQVLLSSWYAHQQPPLCFLAENDDLFTGGDDRSLRCWNLTTKHSNQRPAQLIWQTQTSFSCAHTQIENLQTGKRNQLLLQEKGAHLLTENELVKTIETLSLEECTKALDPQGNRWVHLATFWGYLKALKALQKKGKLLNLLNDKKENALHLLAQRKRINNFTKTISYLLEQGCNKEAKDLYGYTPAYVASRDGHDKCLELLIRANANINQHSNVGSTPTYVASKNGHDKCLALLINAKANINQSNNDSYTPAYAASFQGHDKCLALLIKAKADLNQPTIGGFTPASAASKNGHDKCLALLINANANINELITINSSTPVYIASENGHDKCLALLINANANVHQPVKGGVTPAFIASKNGHDKCLALLINAKANFNQPCKGGGTPALAASLGGHDKCLALLINANANFNQPDYDGYTPVSIACENGHDKCLALLINAKANLNQPAKSGITPAHVACENGHDKCLALLIDAKADVNQSAKGGYTPAYAASLKGHDKCLALLIKANANVHQPDHDGFTPAYAASSEGHDKCLALLTNAKVDVNQPAKGGVTPAHVACANGHDKCLALLIKANANVHQPDKNGETPAFAASQNRHDKCLTLLTNTKANFNQPNKNNDATPVFIASLKGDDKRLALLIKANANVNQPAKGGFTPAYAASSEGHDKCLALLINAKANLNQPAKGGVTPVHAASFQGHDKCLALLINAKANLNQPDNNGETPAYTASLEGHDKCLALLIDAKANINQPNNNGFTPAYVASLKGHNKCLALLIKANANVHQPDKNGETPAFAASQNRHD
ncbi:MAG: ankyrin repeat domain-containing protein, partial [Chlamydiota bacterium]